MTHEEKKDWLGRYAEAEREIDMLTEDIQRWASRAEKVTVSFSHAPAKGGAGSAMEVAIEKIAKLQGKIVKKMGECEEVKDEVQSAIRAVKNPVMREILTKKYVNLDDENRVRTLEVVAVEMQYSFDRVRHLHTDALHALKVDTQ